MPLVSVVMLTYRHAPFVRQAVESVLTQDLDDLEVVVGDDASPDGTQDVLRDLAKEDNRLTLVLRDANIGVARNFADVWARASGDFVAVCEGDDYWTDVTKLSRQVAAMRQAPAAALCFHRVSSELADGAPGPESWPRQQRAAYTLEHLVRSNVLQTCSVLYRGGLVPTLPTWFEDVVMNDWPLHLLHAYRGPMLYLDRDMARYRYHPGGIWSGRAAAPRTLETARMLALAGARSEPPPGVGGRLRRQGRAYAATAVPLAVRDRDWSTLRAALGTAARLPR